MDGHALTLNLLGRFLARAHGGDIRHRDLVKFEEADRNEQGGTTFKMLAAFENWFARSGEFGARQLAVLRMLGLFDRPANAGCISALRKPPVIAGLTDPLFTTSLDANTGQATVQPLHDEDWNTATSFLTDFGLIVIRANVGVSETVLECHPLIREHFAQRVRKTLSTGWRSAHHRLYEHLKASTEQEPATIEKLEPLYQAVTHGCQSGEYRDVLRNVIWDRITRGDVYFNTRQLGTFDSELQALAQFFEKPWVNLVTAVSDPWREWLLSTTGHTLRVLGRFDEAIQPTKTSIKELLTAGAWVGAAQALCNLIELFLLSGQTTSALECGDQCVSIADHSGDNFWRMGSRATFAGALSQAGKRAEALDLFHDAEAIQIETQPNFPLLYAWHGFQYGLLLLAESERWAWQSLLHSIDASRIGQTAAKLARQPKPDRTANNTNSSSDEAARVIRRAEEVRQRSQKMFEMRVPSDSVLAIALDQLMMGHVTLCLVLLQNRKGLTRNAMLKQAREKITAAVDGLRRSSRQDRVPLGLLSRAWLRFLEGNADGTRTDLDEAWDIAERAPMRLHMADIHLYRARLFFREKPYPGKSPEQDLAAAEKLINECGYHRRDEELADAKRAILGNTRT